ncbi:MAG: energy transducer TonB [Verrucomicrobiota bacterium]
MPTIEATLDQPPADEPTPPPEDIPVPDAPPPPDVQPEFHEETTPPPKQTKPAAKVQPIKAPQVAGPPRPAGQMNASGAKAVAISAPRPEYPYEARSRKITGNGVALLTVDVASGSVSDVSMAQSTGNNILDNSAMTAFKRWRFKPGACAPRVRIPITYTMSGASF